MTMLPLHLGVEHPDLVPIALASLAALAVGLGVGLLADRLRRLLAVLPGVPSTE